MEPGILAAAYGVETAVEGTVATGLVVAQPTMPLKAVFQRIPTNQPLPRSSHSLSVIKGKAFIFGGEIKAREPVDNAVHVYTLPSSSVAEADYECVPARAEKEGGEVPPPRVGHTAVAISDRIYVFGGRGGKEMKPLEEYGRVWVYDTKSNSWNYLDPIKASPYPEARSYHTSTSNEHPLPGKVETSTDAVGSPDPNAHGTIFVHGGCPSSGRSTDVWAFDIASRTWSSWPAAPGPARGGAGLTFAQNRLYRFGGFDGETELGGQIDYLDVVLSTINDHSGKGELAITPGAQKWESIDFSADAQGPGNRSVAGFLPVKIGSGRNFLLLFLGEKTPSSLGHEAAGKFWNDVWSFQLQPEGMTPASLKDAARQAVRVKTGEHSWAKVDVPEFSMTEGVRDHPGERGWFASAQGHDVDIKSVVLWGGIDTSNERKGDGWILTVEP